MALLTMRLGVSTPTQFTFSRFRQRHTLCNFCEKLMQEYPILLRNRRNTGSTPQDSLVNRLRPHRNSEGCDKETGDDHAYGHARSSTQPHRTLVEKRRIDFPQR